MNTLRRFLSKLYLYYTFFNFTWLMLLALPLIVFPILIHEKYGSRVAYFFMKIWGVGFCALSGIFFRRTGLENLDARQPYIFTANHGSFLDSPALVYAIPQFFKALGKKEILDYPIFGFIFRFIGVTVDRSNVQSRKRSMALIKEKLRIGHHILIFPEGTMNTTAEPLTRFYDGAFWLAVETQVPIVPVAVCNARYVLSRTTWQLRPGTITIHFGKPIPTAGLTHADTADLKQRTVAAIAAMLAQSTPPAV
jgi:1-acyl-sn-glycerol-3-phosphate acyltransferase